MPRLIAIRISIASYRDKIYPKPACLRESCRYTQQQQETQLNTTAISKALPYQTTTLSLNQIQISTLVTDQITTPSIDQTTALNADQITTPKSNDSVEPPIKDVKQLPTPSRTVSPDLPETKTSPKGLQDNILRTIEAIPI